MPVSRVELSKRTGISKPAVTRGVGDLIAEGLVLEARLGTAGRHGGRRPTLLELNPRAAAGVGCMVGIGELMGCIAGFNGESEHYETVHFDPLADADTVVGQMVGLLQLLIAKNRPGRPLLGLGVSVPGLVDVEGRIVTTPHMPGLRDVELSKLLEERLGLAAYVRARVAFGRSQKAGSDTAAAWTTSSVWKPARRTARALSSMESCGGAPTPWPERWATRPPG